MNIDSKALLCLRNANRATAVLSYRSEQALGCVPQARLTVAADQKAWLSDFVSVSLTSSHQVLFSGVVISVVFDMTCNQSQLILSLPPVFSHEARTQYFSSCTLESLMASLLPSRVHLAYRAKPVLIDSARQYDESSFSFLQGLLMSRGLNFAFHHCREEIIFTVFDQHYDSRRKLCASALRVHAQGCLLRASMAAGGAQLLDVYQQRFLKTIVCEYDGVSWQYNLTFSPMSLTPRAASTVVAHLEFIASKNTEYTVYGAAQSLKAYPDKPGEKPASFCVRLPYFNQCDPTMYNVRNAKVLLENTFPYFEPVVIGAKSSSTAKAAFHFETKRAFWRQKKESLSISAKSLELSANNTQNLNAESVLLSAQQSVSINTQTIALNARESIEFCCGNSRVRLSEAGIEITSDVLCLN